MMREENGDRYFRGSSAAKEDVATHIVSEWDHPDLNLLAGHTHTHTPKKIKASVWMKEGPYNSADSGEEQPVSVVCV